MSFPKALQINAPEVNSPKVNGLISASLKILKLNTNKLFGKRVDKS